jgi:hypothetical protein
LQRRRPRAIRVIGAKPDRGITVWRGAATPRRACAVQAKFGGFRSIFFGILRNAASRVIL